jgi:hypothetical protein
MLYNPRWERPEEPEPPRQPMYGRRKKERGGLLRTFMYVAAGCMVVTSMLLTLLVIEYIPHRVEYALQTIEITILKPQ